MKRAVAILILLTAGVGCRKHSAVATLGVVTNVTYYDMGAHRVASFDFDYIDGRLASFTDQVTDSIPTIESETLKFTFLYGDTGIAPLSYTVTDNLAIPEYSSYTSTPTRTFELRYDGQGRLVSDSLVDTAANCCLVLRYLWRYNGSNAGVYLTTKQAALELYDSFWIVGGNMNSYRLESIGLAYGSVRNPLYDLRIGGSFGPLFFAAARMSSLEWLPYPVDFISKNLPASQDIAVNDDPGVFKWRTDLTGRVTGGTMTDTTGFYGPIVVSFTYR